MEHQIALWSEDGYWRPVKDGNPEAYALYARHYSARTYADGRRTRYGNPNRRLIIGPGEKLLLLGRDGLSLCCWRRYHDASSTTERRVFCTVFRNESEERASTILRAAMALAWIRWPGERLWTYVDPAKIKSEVPGYCFRRAGWKRVGISAGGKLIFAINPKVAEE